MDTPVDSHLNDVAALRETILAKLTYAVGKNPDFAKERDWFVAVALTLRDRIVDRWMDSTADTYQNGDKRVYYLSLEFLIGRQLREAACNLGLTNALEDALSGLGVDLKAIEDIEPDAALGNGGLGRLAACFMESMASVGVPGFGYGIRYDHGLFRQRIVDGWQYEVAEEWLSLGNPWEFERPEVTYEIGFGGSVETINGIDGEPHFVWKPTEKVIAGAYDTPIAGWRGRHVNTLRLWSARALDPMRLDDFNRGDHVGALSDRVRAEAISRVLYPSDSTPAGQELRLRQEYFFASASLQDLIRRHLSRHEELTSLPDKAAIQLNDTHPAIVVPELMRLLTDVYGETWETAWKITQATVSYTNHTLLPEALESWPVPLIERLLPRHMQIIYAINAQFLDCLRREHQASDAALSAVSLIDEDHGRWVRMGNLAFVGSHKVNGVSALHTELIKQSVFKEFHSLFPDRIVNKTNGITPRRWLHQANPPLIALIRETLGDEPLEDTRLLANLVPYAEDSAFRDRFAAAKKLNKDRLAALILERTGVRVDPHALFDVQIKRIHEYKRQLLNILETIALYDAMRAQPMKDWVPRVKIFAGKAAASYHHAKLTIKLINEVARIINSDPAVRNLLKVVFLPNYNVSLAEAIIPAADLSEQISTAGMEASGTGNMKLSLNGALTIGTLDGANVEIRDHVGEDNIFIFGLTAEEVEARRARGIDAQAEVEKSHTLREVLDAVGSGVFSPDDTARYTSLVDTLIHHDYFMVLADFEAYRQAQQAVDALWRTPQGWRRRAVLNTARMGWFSSDRTIREYSDDVWKVTPKY